MYMCYLQDHLLYNIYKNWIGSTQSKFCDCLNAKVSLKDIETKPTKNFSKILKMELKFT